MWWFLRALRNPTARVLGDARPGAACEAADQCKGVTGYSVPGATEAVWRRSLCDADAAGRARGEDHRLNLPDVFVGH